MSPQPQKENESNKESYREKAKNQLQNAKESTPEAIVIDNETVFSPEKILKHPKYTQNIFVHEFMNAFSPFF